MWRIWQMIEPVKLLTGLYIFLGLLAFMIHFILLSTERYNWIENPKPKKTAELLVPSSTPAIAITAVA